MGDDVAASVAECRPRIDVRAGIRSFEIDDQAITLDGDRDVHVDVLVAGRIGIDVDVGLVGAVGPAGDLRGEALGRVADGPVDRGIDSVRTIFGDDFTEPARTELGGAHLGAEVSDEARQSVVGPHGQNDVTAFLAGVDYLQKRIAHALAPDVLGEDVVAAGHRTAGVTVVTLDGREEHQPAVGVEHRGKDVYVRQVPATVKRIVRQDHISRIQIPFEELAGEPDRQGRREHELRDPHRQRGQSAVRVEDGRIALVGLIQDRCRRRPGDVCRHLETDCLHG